MALSVAHSQRLGRAAAMQQQRSVGLGVRQSIPRRSLPIMRVADITTEAEWETEVLQSDKPVLVDFWAPWCGPCRLVAPLMVVTEKEYGNDLKVVKVEHDKNKGLVEKYKVYGLPCFIVFKNGQEVEGSHTEGAMTKAALKEYLMKHALTANVSA